MRFVMALAAVALLAIVPSAQASCHFCAEAVVDTCGSGDLEGCRDSSAYLALHADEAAEHTVDHATETLCRDGCE